MDYATKDIDDALSRRKYNSVFVIKLQAAGNLMNYKNFIKTAYVTRSVSLNR